MAIQNLQLGKHYLLRCEEQHDGAVMLTLVRNNSQGRFEFETTLQIPQQQRANLAHFLCPPSTSSTLTQ